MNRMKILLAAAIIGSAPAACARNSAYDQGSAQPVSGAASVDVSNNYALAMDVFVVSSGVTTRLGSVSPGMHGVFVIDASLMRTGFVQVLAQPLGGGVIANTGSLPLRPGDVVQFDISANPRFSTTTIH